MRNFLTCSADFFCCPLVWHYKCNYLWRIVTHHHTTTTMSYATRFFVPTGFSAPPTNQVCLHCQQPVVTNNAEHSRVDTDHFPLADTNTAEWKALCTTCLEHHWHKYQLPGAIWFPLRKTTPTTCFNS